MHHTLERKNFLNANSNESKTTRRCDGGGNDEIQQQKTRYC